MDRTSKENAVEAFRDSVKDAQAVVLTEFRGLSAGQSVDLRAKVRAVGGQFQVIKNTLAKRAIAGTEMTVINDYLTGPTAWAYSDTDPVAVAKVLTEFVKDANEKLVIKAGYLGGRAMTAADVVALSTLPGKDELRAKLLSVFNAMGTKFVRTLAARPVEFLNVLNARKAELEKAA